MTVEVTPLGVACQLSCTYCYQQPMRDAGNTGAKAYDMAAMKRALVKADQPFSVFGGEPLLVPLNDLEELFRFGLEQYNLRKARGRKQKHGINGIQTNGALITEAHIALFKKYMVHVGFSLDGPDDLNDARWAGTLEKTREATVRSQTAIKRLLKEKGLSASLIVTLHRGNAGTPDRLARLQAWLTDLQDCGLRNARLHILEVDNALVGKKLELSSDENVALFRAMADFEQVLANRAPGKSIKFDIFTDVEKGLRGKDEASCTFRACDPYSTSAVHGVNGQGELSNCGRTNKDGVAWIKADQPGFERQLGLYHTPQDAGGCQGCRFFLQCVGQCVGTAIDGDWRNRSRDCATWMAMFELKERQLQNEGVLPQSLAPDRAHRELVYLQRLITGDIRTGNGGHGDHTDSVRKSAVTHGDHTDAVRPSHTDSHQGVRVERVEKSK